MKDVIRIDDVILGEYKDDHYVIYQKGFIYLKNSVNNQNIINISSENLNVSGFITAINYYNQIHGMFYNKLEIIIKNKMNIEIRILFNIVM